MHSQFPGDIHTSTLAITGAPMNDISIHLTVPTQKAINVKDILETMVFSIMTKLVENRFTSQGRNKMAYYFTDNNTIPGRAEIVHKFFSRPRPRGL